MDVTLEELARLVDGTLVGGENVEKLRITGFAGLDRAGPGDLSFLRAAGEPERLQGVKAAAVVVGEQVEGALRHNTLYRPRTLHTLTPAGAYMGRSCWRFYWR